MGGNGKKKGKKKSTPSTNSANKSASPSPDGVGGARLAGVKSSGGVGVDISSLSLSSSLDNVSPLLFETTHAAKRLPFDIPFVGPIALVEGGKINDGNDSDLQNALVVHGRGLVTTRDVSPGECLFVTPAIISTPVDEVQKRYFLESVGGNAGEDGARLEKITEEVLVDRIQSLCQTLGKTDDAGDSRRVLDSFSAQMSSEEVPSIASVGSLSGKSGMQQNEKQDDTSQAWIEVLLANPSLSNKSKNANNESGINDKLEKDTILNIIRRNAFGPDYHSYNTIAQCWSNKLPPSFEFNNSSSTNNKFYTRLLGIHPLAAMINHSCSPNAVRVFGSFQGKEMMIVHANASIPKGAEITWSYLPPCTDFFTRQEKLHSQYGFHCRCIRCRKEDEIVSSSFYKEWFVTWSEKKIKEKSQIELVQSLEQLFLSNSVSNEVQRYLRVGHATCYIKYFNEVLSSSPANETRSQILKLATQLHFSFLSCNNASTEHISILHLCYELSSFLHTYAAQQHCDSTTTSKTMSQVRFWTEQLKKAHMVRYGSLGEDLESVREVMKHSKMVLRNKCGWFLTQDKFI